MTVQAVSVDLQIGSLCHSNKGSYIVRTKNTPSFSPFFYKLTKNLYFRGVSSRYKNLVPMLMDRHSDGEHALILKNGKAEARLRRGKIAVDADSCEHADLLLTYLGLVLGSPWPAVAPGIFSANRFGQYHSVTGTLEVNFNYYPSWEGKPRVVELSIQRAREMGVPFLWLVRNYEPFRIRYKSNSVVLYFILTPSI